MDPLDPDIGSALREALRHGREVSAPGFTDRAVVAVRRDVRRRRVLRWVAFSGPLAAAAALLLYVGIPAAGRGLSERDLAQVASLHASVMVSPPRLDDSEALAALVVADFEVGFGMPRLEGGEETIAALVLADS